MPGLSPARAAAEGCRDRSRKGLGYAERRAATNVRLAEEAFYDGSERVASLALPDIAEATHGAQLVYRDPLGSLFLQEDGPHPLAYAVVSTRRDGERSPLSNIVSITPGIAPQAPELLPAILDEGRVCLEGSRRARTSCFSRSRSAATASIGGCFRRTSTRRR